jgi:hypothetical protein
MKIDKNIVQKEYSDFLKLSPVNKFKRYKLLLDLKNNVYAQETAKLIENNSFDTVKLYIKEIYKAIYRPLRAYIKGKSCIKIREFREFINPLLKDKDIITPYCLREQGKSGELLFDYNKLYMFGYATHSTDNKFFSINAMPDIKIEKMLPTFEPIVYSDDKDKQNSVNKFVHEYIEDSNTHSAIYFRELLEKYNLTRKDLSLHGVLMRHSTVAVGNKKNDHVEVLDYAPGIYGGDNLNFKKKGLTYY